VTYSGGVPGYFVSFVRKIRQDASGRAVSVPGSRHLEIRFSPAAGHTATGRLTLPATPQAAGYPMLRGYALAGDFEGDLTIALGLAGQTRFRTGEVYLDVAW
jgi:hypothetical protein